MNIKIGENARSMLRLLRLVLIDKTNRKSHKWRNDPTQLKRNKPQVEFQRYLGLLWLGKLTMVLQYLAADVFVLN